MKRIPVRHPELLDQTRIDRVYALWRQERIPSSIAGWMIATPLIHQLRAIFGSNAAAAGYLAGLAFEHWWNGIWQGWMDLLYWLPWLLAVVWTHLWGGYRCVRYGREPWIWRWGRWESPEPIRCAECAWKGPRRWAVHS